MESVSSILVGRLDAKGNVGILLLLIQSWIISNVLYLLLAYPLIVSFLRYRRIKNTLDRFPYPDRASLTSMTDNDAQLIQASMAQLEFPFTFEKALQFALFRTYGIPSISKLLVETSQLSQVDTACKRYTDTALLITEYMAHAPADPRAVESITRMNQIHSGYQRAGKISNNDMLYTLSLFAVEPIRWIDKYEWRKLTEVEKCAIGTFWKSIGDDMGIDYGTLKSPPNGFIDGLQWLEKMTDWSQKYEEKYMVPDQNNKTTGDETTKILLWTLPRSMKKAGVHAVSALMDDRLRTAMMYETPPPIYFFLIKTIFGIRKILLRYLALPRPYFMRYRSLTDDPTKDGRYFLTKYDACPYYVQPTWWARWSPSGWITWMMGLPLPGDEGQKYHPNGYRIQEVGPDNMRGKGAKRFEEMRSSLEKTRTGSCPFVGGKS